MKKLLSPLKVRDLELKNRLVLPPMATAKAEEDGAMSEDILNYYDEKTKDGILSLVIVEHSFISEEGRANKRQMSASADTMIEGLVKLRETIHRNGSFAVMQINHAGMYARQLDETLLPVGPSTSQEKEVRALQKEDLGKIIDDFTKAASRCKEAGFDGVEIHSAHGYLLNQFYSPLINKRTDEYGGSLLNRIRLHVEIIRAVRHAVGPDYPVFIRLGASDYKDGGTTIEDSVTAARIFEKEGIDLLDISGGFCGYTHPHMTRQGYFCEITEAIKKEVSIPVLLTGGVTDLHAAEELLMNEQTDLIGIGRPIFKDSDFLKNALDSFNK